MSEKVRIKLYGHVKKVPIYFQGKEVGTASINSIRFNLYTGQPECDCLLEKLRNSLDDVCDNVFLCIKSKANNNNKLEQRTPPETDGVVGRSICVEVQS